MMDLVPSHKGLWSVIRTKHHMSSSRVTTLEKQIQALKEENNRLLAFVHNINKVLGHFPELDTATTPFVPPGTHLFLKDTFLYQTKTHLLSIRDAHAVRNLSSIFSPSELNKFNLDPEKPTDIFCVTLKDNIFSPQKGGQPSDVGRIYLEKQPDVVWANVVKVMESKEGEIQVFVVPMPESVLAHFSHTTHLPVIAEVDKDARIMHSRLHSAGHLLDLAVQRAGMTQWTGNKGYHFPLGPYVEYNIHGQSFDDKDTFLQTVQDHIDDLLGEDGAVKVEYLTPKEVERRLGSIPEWFTGDHLRIVSYGDASCPCSGTHVQRFSQIGQRIKVKKGKKKKQCFRISYELVGDL
mmetsp:Transcript_7731/g.28981  ORF Transcript_7731/g.28981 Transcript_7731/m.28981 type:complete len:350 (+) Transcript_7731:81-1130(+)